MIEIILFGVVLSIAGLVAVGIMGWSIALVIVFCGLVFAFGWLWFGKHKWQLRFTKQGVEAMPRLGVAIAKTSIVLTVVGLINWVGVSLNLRWEKNDRLNISQQSQEIVSQLEQPLEVLVFDRNINPELEKLLQNYRRYNKQFQFRFIDPDREIGLVRQFGVQSWGEIYLRYGEKQQLVNNAEITQIPAETQLTNAIENIKRDRQTNIYFLQGHGEASLELVEGGLGRFVQTLEDLGNKVNILSLATTGKIPHDAELIVIAGATRKLLPAEVSTLQQYLKAGGSLLLLLSPKVDIGITPILQNWGIDLDDCLVVDGSGAGEIMGFGPAVIIVDDYGQHPITSRFDNGISLFPEVRPLKVLEKANVESTALVISDRQTWAESDLRSEEITFDSTKDLPGPLNIAIASSRRPPNPSRIVVFGSTTFATNGWLEQQLNGDLLVNSISWLIEEEEIAIRPLESDRRFNLSPIQAAIISWLALRIMPFIALVGGVFVWWKKR